MTENDRKAESGQGDSHCDCVVRMFEMQEQVAGGGVPTGAQELGWGQRP